MYFLKNITVIKWNILVENWYFHVFVKNLKKVDKIDSPIIGVARGGNFGYNLY